MCKTFKSESEISAAEDAHPANDNLIHNNPDVWCGFFNIYFLEFFCFSFLFASLLPDEKATFDGNFSAQPFWHLHYFWLIFSLDPSLDIYITFPEDENKNTSVLAQFCFIKQQFLQIFTVVANIKEIIKKLSSSLTFKRIAVMVYHHQIILHHFRVSQ